MRIAALILILFFSPLSYPSCEKEAVDEEDLIALKKHLVEEYGMEYTNPIINDCGKYESMSALRFSRDYLLEPYKIELPFHYYKTVRCSSIYSNSVSCISFDSRKIEYNSSLIEAEMKCGVRPYIF